MGWLSVAVLRGYALAGPVMMLLYPLYASIMAIESADKEDDQQWLTYWVLYSVVSLLEMAAGPVIAWIPFYSTMKLVIASWLVLPQFRGGIILYEKFVSPYLNAATGQPDQKLTHSQRKVLGSISPDAQASVAAYIKENGPGSFDELMRRETANMHDEKVAEEKKHDGSSSSDSE
jgi:receptor expression-enhancing protein 5/6